MSLSKYLPPAPPSLKIGKEISRGGNGTVHAGEFEGRPVAVKRVHGLLLEAVRDGQGDVVLTAFGSECKRLESITHPQIVGFKGAFYDQHSCEPLLVMERMDQDLRDLLNTQKGTLSYRRQLQLCLDIAKGLHFLHTQDPPLVHRDLSAKNILLDKSGRAKIGDLGQSKLKTAAYFQTLQPGAVVYMPPEALEAKPRYDEKIDIFSFGVLMLEIATQKEPSPGMLNIGSMEEKDRRQRDLACLQANHPLKPLILRCLNNIPSKRPDAAAVLVELEKENPIWQHLPPEAALPCRWFHPNLKAKEAEELLLTKGQDSSFLVRPSQSTPGDYTLSARRGSEVTHVKIQSTEEYFDLYGGEKFATLAELLEHYTDSQNSLREANGQIITLKVPLYVEEVTNERWYHGPLPGKDSETLLQKTPPGSFLVRASIRSPGNYVVSVKVDDSHITHIKINNTDGQFDVGDGRKFKTLNSLVDHFRQAPMVETSGSVVRLKQPVNATRVISSHIQGRISDLMKVATENFGKAGFWEEFEQLQQQEHKNLYSRKEGAKPENKKKNRYKNILPFDHTRVTLKDAHPSTPGSDYINANYITDECGEVKYIATQGCVPDTVNDFWRMVWQEDSRVIVMLTNEIERGMMKCQRYWPKVQKEAEFGPFLVVTVSEDKKPHYILRELLIQKAAPEVFKGEDGVEEGYDELEEPRTIYHFHFTAWPDHGVPQDPTHVLAYLDDVYQLQKQLKELELSLGPVVVHCSTGIGRTGTFIIVDLLLNKIAREGVDCEIDIQKSILSVRAQRSGMVQTELQYKFIYLVISTHIQTLQVRSRMGKNYGNSSYPPVSSSKATGKSDEPEHLYTNLEFVTRDQPNSSHQGDPQPAQVSAPPDQ